MNTVKTNINGIEVKIVALTNPKQSRQIRKENRDKNVNVAFIGSDDYPTIDWVPDYLVNALRNADIDLSNVKAIVEIS